MNFSSGDTFRHARMTATLITGANKISWMDGASGIRSRQDFVRAVTANTGGDPL